MQDDDSPSILGRARAGGRNDESRPERRPSSDLPDRFQRTNRLRTQVIIAELPRLSMTDLEREATVAILRLDDPLDELLRKRLEERIAELPTAEEIAWEQRELERAYDLRQFLRSQMEWPPGRQPSQEPVYPAARPKRSTTMGPDLERALSAQDILSPPRPDNATPSDHDSVVMFPPPPKYDGPLAEMVASGRVVMPRSRYLRRPDPPRRLPWGSFAAWRRTRELSLLAQELRGVAERTLDRPRAKRQLERRAKIELLLRDGYSNRKIAEMLGVDESTIREYRKRMA